MSDCPSNPFFFSFPYPCLLSWEFKNDIYILAILFNYHLMIVIILVAPQPHIFISLESRRTRPGNNHTINREKFTGNLAVKDVRLRSEEASQATMKD